MILSIWNEKRFNQLFFLSFWSMESKGIESISSVIHGGKKPITYTMGNEPIAYKKKKTGKNVNLELLKFDHL